MKVLVHYDSMGTVAHGLWWVDASSGQPQSLYRYPESPEAARGALIIFNKSNPDVSWETHFDVLTTRQPYSEDWVTYDSMGFTPEQMLRALAPVEGIAS